MSVNRKFLAGTVTTALVASAVAPAAAAEEAQYNAQEELFTDVPETNSHFENIYKAVDYGLLSGYPDGTFKPLNALTRSNVVKALGKFVIASEGYDNLADYLADNDLSSVEPFNDVTADSRDSELYNFSLIVKEAGIFQGSNNNLMPSNNITRQQMAQVIVNAFSLDEVETDNEAVVEDLDTAFSSYRDDIQILANLGVTTVSNFRPLDETSRGHLASFLTTAYEVSTDEDGEELASGISGFVSQDDNAPAEGAVVSIGDQEAVTDENGFFQLLNVPAGDAEVSITKEGYKTVKKDATILEDTVTAFDGDLGDKIVTTAISVTGNIVNGDTGADVDNAIVSIQKLDEEGEWTELLSQEDVDGSYEVKNDKDVLELGGEYRLVVEADGFKSYTQDITLDDQKTVNTLAGIQLDEIEKMDLTVNVTDAAGDEVTTANVKVYEEGNDTPVLERTDEFDFSDLQLESGSYELVIDDGTSAVSYTELTIEEGTDLTTDVQLEEGNEVTAKFGLEEVDVDFDSEGAIQVELLRGGTSVVTETLTGSDEDSITATFSRVAPADYSLRISGDYVQTKTFPSFTVDGDETVEERVMTAGVVIGTVLNDNEAVVNLLNEEGEIVETTTPSDEGVYKFSGIASGDYTVEVISETRKNASAEVTVSSNTSTPQNFDLGVLPTSASVSGVVRIEGSLAAVNSGTIAYYNEDGELAASTEITDGKYTVTELVAGTYEVVVRDGENAENPDQTEIDTLTDSITVVAGDELTSINYLAKQGGDAALEITAVDSEGEEIDLTDAVVELTDAYYANDEDDETTDLGVWNTTADASTISFDNLSAGTYDFDLTLGSFVDYEGTATIASGEAAELEITLEETASQREVDFKVLDESNVDKTSSVKAVIFNEDGTVKEVLADDATSVDLMDGDYTIAFYLDGYAVSTRDFTVDGEDVTIPVVQLVEISN
ncbi:carboxypeptidase regulatory-like domain-containing protein [Jeotgalibacillus terrae]|uniref:Carboxypeptidase regulatory-like domain-containing protein n=1 Tax=Jeotgalibacillus terrae TaxID=587735 RepID=A0ABW5ZC88_9BACL|nr:carboxypeptidase regulatory-like domain-containing protein [Jeotgalibacillus terrae]MBM7577800.1 hypothetical protein [Jeotgalibacillus terrae]